MEEDQILILTTLNGPLMVAFLETTAGAFTFFIEVDPWILILFFMFFGTVIVPPSISMGITLLKLESNPSRFVPRFVPRFDILHSGTTMATTIRSHIMTIKKRTTHLIRVETHIILNVNAIKC
jgi:hypothetical protein